MAIVGLDVGYGWTKRYTKSGGLKFPTNVRPFREEKALGEADFVEVNGKKYEIGVMEGITETRDRQFFLSDEFLAVVFYALKDYNEGVRLGIGLPPAWLDIREEVARRLTGVHEFYYHGKKKLRIQAYVFPQGWGGYIDHIYNLDGRYLANKDIPALFVDVGYYTLDTILTEMVWKGTKPVIKPKKTEEPTLPFGISRFLEIWKAKLEENGIEVPSVKYLEGFLTNDIPLYKSLWVSDSRYKKTYEEAYREWATEFEGNVIPKLKKYLPYIQAIVVFGGGAELVKPVLETLGKPVEVKDQFANARGFYKAVLAKSARRR